MDRISRSNRTLTGRSERPVWVALAAGVCVFLLSYRFLTWLLLFNNSGVMRFYGSRSLGLQAIRLFEHLAFLPTLWLTKPLARPALEAGLVGWMSLAEVLALSVLYAALAVLVVQRRLRPLWNRWFSRRPWLPWLVALMLLAIGYVIPGGMP